MFSTPRKLLLSNLSLSNYSRMDIVVRVMYIEYFLNQTGEGKSLYEKMQNIRVPHSKKNHVLRFNQLIHSFQNSGFSKLNRISINRKNELLDGAHRLACCIYFNKLDKWCLVKKSSRTKSDYDINWFLLHFEKDEIDILVEKYNSIYSLVLENNKRK